MAVMGQIAMQQYSAAHAACTLAAGDMVSLDMGGITKEALTFLGCPEAECYFDVYKTLAKAGCVGIVVGKQSIFYKVHFGCVKLCQTYDASSLTSVPYFLLAHVNGPVAVRDPILQDEREQALKRRAELFDARHRLDFCLDKRRDYPCPFKACDVVLCRYSAAGPLLCTRAGTWKIDFFSHYAAREQHPFVCVGGAYTQCLPFEEYRDLLGTVDTPFVPSEER